MKKFKPIAYKKAFRYLMQRSYGPEVGRENTAEFIGKDNRKYYIAKRVNTDCFFVYDSEATNKALNTRNSPVIPIALANFNTSGLFLENNKFFTGFENNDSITVDVEYRRKGIATAIINFAELKYNAPYAPTSVLSEEMKHFIKTYEHIVPSTNLG